MVTCCGEGPSMKMHEAYVFSASGTNLVDAAETADCIAEDAQQGRLPGRQGAGIREELARHGVQVGFSTSLWPRFCVLPAACVTLACRFGTYLSSEHGGDSSSM